MKNDPTGETTEIKQIEEEIADILAEEGRTKAQMFVKYCEKSGELDISAMWKLKKRLWPKQTPALPVAKTNYEGRLLSAPADLKILMMKEYKDRLRSRPVHQQMKHQKVMKNKVKA